MEWRTFLGELESVLEDLTSRGVHFLSLKGDPELASELDELITRLDASQPEVPATPRSFPAGSPPHPEKGTPSESRPQPNQRQNPFVGRRGPANASAGPMAGEKETEHHQPPPPPKSLGEIQSLESLSFQYRKCQSCKLGATRNRLVFGVGHPSPEILFIGEGPGAEEDQQGLPFVGRAGALLTVLIKALGLTREDVYITNVVKCRPPGNRNPEPDEIAACAPILDRQIELLNPALIVSLGSVALKALKPSAAGITRERGSIFHHQGKPVLPTYHPSYLLRNPDAIVDCWKDFRQAFDQVRAMPDRD